MSVIQECREQGCRADDAAAALCHRERGLLVLTCGDRSIRLAPPLVVTKAQADVALSIIGDALQAMER